jgi:hypothetical protein
MDAKFAISERRGSKTPEYTSGQRQPNIDLARHSYYLASC